MEECTEEAMEIQTGVVDEEHLQAIDEEQQQVVQIIMQDDSESGTTSLPGGQIVQLNTPEGIMQYIQVTNEDGENQLLQVSSDGQAQFIQLPSADGGSELFQISSEPPAELLEEQPMSPGQEDGAVVPSSSEETVAEQPVVEEEQNVTMEQSDDFSSIEPGTSLLITTSVETPITDSEPAVSVAGVESADTLEPVVEETPIKVEPEKAVDVASPIELTSETIVTVGGKKCVLRVDPATNHLVAYPVAKPGPGKRPRGRPRKVKPEPRSDQADADSSLDASELESGEAKPSTAPSEQENSAAEGLLGLSEADGRRKSLRVKKKSKVLNDYETGAIDGVEEAGTEETPDEPDADPDVPEPASLPSPVGLKRGRGRPPKNPNMGPSTANQVQNFLANLGLPVKRGRGRPRRNPPAGGLNSPIPAFIIPSPGGQAVMMAPVQGMNLQAIQRAQLADILPKTTTEGKSSMQPPVIIQNADGSQTHIFQAPMEGQEEKVLQLDEAGLAAESVDTSEPMLDESVEDLNTEATLQEDESVVTTDAGHTVVDPSSIVVTTTAGCDASILDSSVVAVDEKGDAIPGTGMGNLPPATIIQLPQHLVPLLVPKKDPVKIGLKASERDLEKMKCSKCDFQAFYQQQFQEHMLTEHANDDDIQRCKCCSFLTFDSDDLLRHFKETHPKCICNVCDFTAEHAYVIKRHMLRHSAKGCECEICGKTYKDQYILKMHIKMVHMPAEVLFECNICAKKFNRKAHLKRHLRIHEPEKPFKCPHCDYRGCERSDVTKHLLIHEEPQHICEVCGKTFRHIKNKELHVKRHKGQRDYKCGVCDFYGYTFTDIRKHIERKHADTKNILCDKCGYAFKSDAALREHKRKQCEVVMIEQALSLAEEQGDDEHGVQISAAQLGVDGHILVDGNQVNITVEQVALPDGVPVSLGEGTSLVTSEGQTLSVSEAEVLQGHHHHHHHVSNEELAHMMTDGQVIHTTAVDMSEAVAVELTSDTVHLTAEDLAEAQTAEFVTTSVEEDNMIQITE